jgi:hypothetical protein
MKCRTRTAFPLLLLIAVGTFPALAIAQQDMGVDVEGANERPENGYWSEGKPRWFLAQRTELGPPYIKPYVSAGYGLPHWIWTGVDVNAIATLDMVQLYAGLRAASPVLDLAFGLRDTWSFDKPLLVPADRFTGADVRDASGASLRYLAWEAEAVAVVPLPHFAVAADFIAVRTLDVPADRAIYDESYRVIVDDPLFFDLRAGAVVRLLREQALKVGPVVEYLFGTGRGTSVRLGGAVILQLTDHLEASATVTVPVRSPDQLGLVLGSYAAAGVRYRTATGEKHPTPPWGGRIIPW